jgi:hypothetical protein
MKSNSRFKRFLPMNWIAGFFGLTCVTSAFGQDHDYKGGPWNPPVGEYYGRHYNIGTCTIDHKIQVRRPINGDEAQGGQLTIEAVFYKCYG